MADFGIDQESALKQIKTFEVNQSLLVDTLANYRSENFGISWSEFEKLNKNVNPNRTISLSSLDQNYLTSSIQSPQIQKFIDNLQCSDNCDLSNFVENLATAAEFNFSVKHKLDSILQINSDSPNYLDLRVSGEHLTPSAKVALTTLLAKFDYQLMEEL